MLYRKFYFPENGSEGAEGGAAGNAGAAPAELSKPVDSILTAEDLKEYGLENADQLKTLLRQHKESNIPVADKEKAEQEKKADFISFAAKNGHMKVEEINTYETVKSKADRELVFEKHLEQFKEDNPDITDPDELTAQAKADFESEYKLTSDNEKQKSRGEARMKKDAEELRSPYTSKYEKTQSAYQERKALEGKLPEFNKAIASLIEKCTPDKLPISKVKDGEEEFPIEVELTKKERDELIQAFVTPKTYQEYLKNEKDLSKFEGAVRKKIDGFLKVKYFETSLSKAFQTGKGRGVVKGSNIGAEQPFSVIKGKGAPGKEANGVQTIEQSNQKIATARARYAR